MDRSKKILQYFPIILIFCYSLCSAFALFMSGDDYIWYYADSTESLSGYRVPNGRYFSNFITKIIVRNAPVRTIFYTVSLVAFLIIFSRLADYKNKSGRVRYYFVILCFTLIPASTYAEVLNWISGYTNYLFSTLLTAVYICFFFRTVFSDYTPKICLVPLFFGLSLAGGLCVEHVTIYNIILAISSIVIIYKKRKRVFPHSIFYLVGAVTAAVIMFSNSMYNTISESGDSLGNRSFEIHFADAFMNAFLYVVMHYARDYWIVNIIITLSFVIIYYNNYETVKKSKYATLCMLICCCFTMYSVFTSCFSDFRVMSLSMTVRALETAFAFIYVVAIAYNVWIYFDAQTRFRAYLYLLSTLLVSGPFLFVSPVTARCFFVNYMFWILLCGEIFFSAAEYIKIEMAEKFFTAMSACAVALMMNIGISNKYCDVIRFNYIKEQVDSNAKIIQCIKLPYEEYVHDDLCLDYFFDGILDHEQSYGKYTFMYHGIENGEDYKDKLSLIDIYDYRILTDG